jgi:P-type Cu+ transporter
MTATEIPAASPTTAAPVSPIQTVRLGIDGMHCASCVARVELERTPGVVDATVNLMSQEATASYLPKTTDVAGLEDAARRAGYTPKRPRLTKTRSSARTAIASASTGR